MQFYPISRAHILAPRGGLRKDEAGTGLEFEKKEERKTLILRCASIGPRSIVLFTHKRIGISLSALLGCCKSRTFGSNAALYCRFATYPAPVHTYKPELEHSTTSGYGSRECALIRFGFGKSNREKSSFVGPLLYLLSWPLSFSSISRGTRPSSLSFRALCDFLLRERVYNQRPRELTTTLGVSSSCPWPHFPRPNPGPDRIAIGEIQFRISLIYMFVKAILRASKSERSCTARRRRRRRR